MTACWSQFHQVDKRPDSGDRHTLKQGQLLQKLGYFSKVKATGKVSWETSSITSSLTDGVTVTLGVHTVIASFNLNFDTSLLTTHSDTLHKLP